jgi:parallel beta-helix repeat protein
MLPQHIYSQSLERLILVKEEMRMKKALMFVLIALLISSFVSQMSIRAEVYEPRKVENVEMNTQDELGSIGGSNTESEQDELSHDREILADLTQATGPLAVPPTEWSRPYGGADTDRAWSVLQTSDGGYLIVGDTYSYGSGSYDFWIVKTDSSGNQQWAKPYGGSASEGARSVARTYDGGYIVAGYIDPPGPDPADVWIVKIDATGNKQWDLQWGGSNRDMAYSVIQSSDGRYIVAGYTMSFGAGNEDAFLLKIDPVLGTSFVFYGGPNSDVARCVVQTCDGGFAIAGYTKSYGSGSYDFWLIKTDYAGNMLWQKTHGNTGSDMAYSIAQTCEGGYILAGDTDYYTAGSCDFWVVKTNSVGNLAWSQKFGGTGFDSASSVVQTCDGGYLVAGETTSFGAVLEDFWVVKTDSSLLEQWRQRYGGSGSDSAYSAVQASDGGYAIAGPTSSYGAGSNDFWLVKLGYEYQMADLRILPRMQHKDTKMLCLDGCSLSGVHAWDVPHLSENWQECPHDNMYCTRASISMINSYYGGRLSQDRISYYYFEQLHRDGKPGPEGDLGHNVGMPADEALSWALNGAVGNHYSEKPDFSLIKQWIDAGKPILRYAASGVGHFTVIDGYAIVGSENRVHLLDPWYGSQCFVSYSGLSIDQLWWTPASATPRSDEDWNSNGTLDTIEDSDSDGVCDFDEIYRFFTMKAQSDTDSDGVPDKAEIIGYTFLADGSWDASDIRKPNFDNDFDGEGRPLRAERDYDSDNGGIRDGLEDKNGNGFFEPALGETDPLSSSDDPNVVHLESGQDNAATTNLGSIKFAGSSYSLPNDITKTAGTYPIEYSAVPGYQFYQWETTPGVSVADPNAWSTTATVSGSGTLKAIYKAIFAVHLESVQDNGASSNLGTITFDGTSYSLPNDVSKPAGNYQTQCYPSLGYIFDHWETAEGVSVSNAYNNPTTATVSGAGTLTAVYKEGECKVHNLNTGLNYSTIQAALDAPETLDGHTIFVDEGVYHERVIVRKSITLLGEDRSTTVIDGDGSTVINVQANNVTITRLTIQNGWSGIFVDRFNGTEILNNTITFNIGTGIGDGIYILRSHGNTIANNTISHNTEDGLTLAPNTTDTIVSDNTIFSNGGSGVYMHDHADNNIIIHNNITLNGAHGIYMAKAFSNQITDSNCFTGNRYDGIHLYCSSSNVFTDNNASANNSSGIYLHSSLDNMFSGNSVNENRDDGILALNSSNNYICGNSVMNNAHEGICLGESSEDDTLTDNEVIGNGYNGIKLDRTSNTTLFNNYLVNNGGNGIILYNSSSNSLSKNNSTSNHWNGIFLCGGSNSNILTMNSAVDADHYGIEVNEASNNTLLGNEIAHNDYGIYVYSSSNNTVLGNNVMNNCFGVWLASSNRNIVSGNNITNNDYGIWLYNSPHNTISESMICKNEKGGIWVQYSDGSGIIGNAVNTNGGQGIIVLNSSDCNLEDNNVRDSLYCGMKIEWSRNATIKGNDLASNGEGGIWLDTSECSFIEANNITGSNTWPGIGLHRSPGCVMARNNVSGNPGDGITLENSNDCRVISNLASKNPHGVNLLDSSDCSILNNTLNENEVGIYLDSSNGSLIDGNTVSEATSLGIFISHSNGTTLTGNDIGQNQGQGLYLWYSSNCIIAHNNASNNGCSGIRLYDSDNSTLIGNIATKNVEHGIWLDYAGKAVLIGNKAVENGKVGISLGYSHDSIVDGNTASDNVEMGFWIDYSVNLQLAENTACNNTDAWAFGFRLDACSNSTISRNVATGNNATGIQLFSSENCTIAENLAAYNNLTGIWLHNTSDTAVIKNDVYGNYHHGIGFYNSTNCKAYENNVNYNGLMGIWLDSSSSSIVGNNVTYNACGIGLSNSCLANSSDSKIFHNNFVNNTQQAFSENSNAWNDTYPSGGNFWSDYAGVDLYSSPYQNETGSDGMGDTPYVIDEDNQDSYPLMKPFPWGQHDIGITGLSTSKTVCGQGCLTNVSIMVFNYGENTETSNVTAYANGTIPIEMVSLELAGRTSVTLNFTWNTTGLACGNYTISAYAEPVMGETDTDDNRKEDGSVLVTYVGDFNGDLTVDYRDDRIFGWGYIDYGKTGEIGHGFECCDLNEDGKIDYVDDRLFGWAYIAFGQTP